MAPVFAASGFGTFSQAAKASVFTRFSLLSLFERTQDMASSLICSLILENAVNYSTSRYTGIYLCFVFAASTRFAGFSVLSMCEEVQDMVS